MRAGELYMEASRAPAAAQALSKGAKILEEKDPQVRATPMACFQDSAQNCAPLMS